MQTQLVQDLPECDRPRERLRQYGAEALSTSELIAIILGSGIKGRPVMQLAHEIISHFKTLEALSQATLAELSSLKGLGPAKALQLLSAINLGSRLAQQQLGVSPQLTSPSLVYAYMKRGFAEEPRELLAVILLDVKGHLIAKEVISVGTLSKILIHPREVFYPAIRHKASCLVMVHNHPSGDPTPSPEDCAITNDLVAAGKLVGIPISDHIVIARSGYVSLRSLHPEYFL